ncbi:MAG: FMN-binding protein [Candidatus Brocadiia bacterium]
MNQKKPGTLKKILVYGSILMCVCLASGASLAVLYQNTQARISKNDMRAFIDAMKKALATIGELEVVVSWPSQVDIPEDGKIMLQTETGEKYVAIPVLKPLGAGQNPPADAITVGSPAANKTYIVPKSFQQNFKLIQTHDPLFILKTRTGVRYAATGSEQGYQSRVTVMAAIDAKSVERPASKNPSIFRVAVVTSNETPGLGERIKEKTPDATLWEAILGKSGNGKGKRPAFQEQFTGKKLSDLEVIQDGGTVDALTGATITSRATTTAAAKAIRRIVRETNRLYGTKASGRNP